MLKVPPYLLDLINAVPNSVQNEFSRIESNVTPEGESLYPAYVRIIGRNNKSLTA